MTDFPRQVSAGGVSVETNGAALSAPRDAGLDALIADGALHALAEKDPTLWGAEATPEATVRLGWLDCTRLSRPLLPRLAELRKELVAEGLDRVVLAGMGGSSLAPEVITRTYGVDLVVLDTTDPGQVRAAMVDLERTVVVVSSKSGGTIETDSHRRAFLQAFRGLGLSDAEAQRRLVVVTDPDSPLQHTADQDGVRATFLADPNVGGRYSALTAFGLVPAALAGAPVGDLLDQAAAVEPSLGRSAGNPGAWLGAALGAAGTAGRNKVVLADAGSGIVGFADSAGRRIVGFADSASRRIVGFADSASRRIVGFADWAEQLLAESTGKHEKGLLPVAVESTDAPGFANAADLHLVALGAGELPTGTAVNGPLGAQFLVWEFATAVAGRLLGINPFDQPNVQESKDNTNAVLEKAGEGPLPEGDPAFSDGPVEVWAGDPALLEGVRDLPGALSALLGAVPPSGYLAVMAYLDRHADAVAAQLRPALAARLAHPVTFGWGPRFLHSTGQFHKGGPQVGAFLQITGAVSEDLAIPDRPFTFGKLQAAQALGDRQALESRGRPLVRIHLTDRAAGLKRLLAAARG